MGNHAAGLAMSRAAAALAAAPAAPRSASDALALLDRICAPYRGADAEFESEDPAHPGRLHPDYEHTTDPRAPLGQLMVEAFAPGTTYPALAQDPDAPGFDEARYEEDYDRWARDVEAPFRARYAFC